MCCIWSLSTFKGISSTVMNWNLSTCNPDWEWKTLCSRSAEAVWGERKASFELWPSKYLQGNCNWWRPTPWHTELRNLACSRCLLACMLTQNSIFRCLLQTVPALFLWARKCLLYSEETAPNGVCSLRCFVSSDIPVMKYFPAQSTLFTSATLALMRWLICAHLHITELLY